MAWQLTGYGRGRQRVRRPPQRVAGRSGCLERQRQHEPRYYQQRLLTGIFPKKPYSLLETSQIGWAESVGLGNDRNQVHTGAQTLHDFDVEGFQGVTGRTDKVETGMDTEIDLVRSAGLLLLQHI